MKNESLGKKNPSKFTDSFETTSIKTINSVLSGQINNFYQGSFTFSFLI